MSVISLKTGPTHLHPLFEAHPAVWKKFSDVWRRRMFTEGASIISHGDAAAHLWLVLKGWVKLSRQTPDGKETIIGLCTEGDVFGEAALFAHANYPYHAEVIGHEVELAANGAMVTPYGITTIETARGKVLYQRKSVKSGRVLGERVVAMMNEMLISVVSSGTGRRAQIGRPMAGKTGTTSDYKDAWFIGYTPSLATGVWVGNDDNAPMKKVTGGGLPSGIWRAFMQPATAKMPALGLPIDTSEDTPLPWHPTPEGGLFDTPADEQEGPRDLKLGPSFWDKLMGP